MIHYKTLREINKTGQEYYYVKIGDWDSKLYCTVIKRGLIIFVITEPRRLLKVHFKKKEKCFAARVGTLLSVLAYLEFY